MPGIHWISISEAMSPATEKPVTAFVQPTLCFICYVVVQLLCLFVFMALRHQQAPAHSTGSRCHAMPCHGIIGFQRKPRGYTYASSRSFCDPPPSLLGSPRSGSLAGSRGVYVDGDEIYIYIYIYVYIYACLYMCIYIYIVDRQIDRQTDR